MNRNWKRRQHLRATLKDQENLRAFGTALGHPGARTRPAFSQA